MHYEPKAPQVKCACGLLLQFTAENLVEEDTGDYEGAIWQSECPCGRAYTIEIASDPDYPSTRLDHKAFRRLAKGLFVYVSNDWEQAWDAAKKHGGTVWTEHHGDEGYVFYEKGRGFVNVTCFIVVVPKPLPATSGLTQLVFKSRAKAAHARS